MKNVLIVSLIKWVSNLGVRENEFPIKIHSSQEALEISNSGRNGSILENLYFGRICVNSWTSQNLLEEGMEVELGNVESTTSI
jgi:hypothetical protein